MQRCAQLRRQAPVCLRTHEIYHRLLSGAMSARSPVWASVAAPLLRRSKVNRLRGGAHLRNRSWRGTQVSVLAQRILLRCTRIMTCACIPTSRCASLRWHRIIRGHDGGPTPSWTRCGLATAARPGAAPRTSCSPALLLACFVLSRRCGEWAGCVQRARRKPCWWDRPPPWRYPAASSPSARTWQPARWRAWRSCVWATRSTR
jgi:hypothetical protein